MFKVIKNAVLDIDGNAYDGIEIGGEVWMASNLRTTKFNDGSFIRIRSESRDGKYPYFMVPSAGYRNEYGLLYNYKAVRTGMLAPRGWRVATDKDWNGMLRAAAADPSCNLDDSETRPYAAKTAKALCSCFGWSSCDVIGSPGKDPDGNNVSGFGAYPAGYGGVLPEHFHLGFGETANFWCDAGIEAGEYARRIRISFNDPAVSNSLSACTYGFSVRCVRI